MYHVPEFEVFDEQAAQDVGGEGGANPYEEVWKWWENEGRKARF